MRKIAVVLFNLGGPDNLQAVKPFLFNLFFDKAIIRVPLPLRYALAKLISGRREKTARHIYARIGGKSPILEQTQAQAQALQRKLNESAEGEFRVFVSMRYWHPRSRKVVRQVKNYAPDEVVLLPLYPQFSSTTTASSFAEWKACAKVAGLNATLHALCCYHGEPHFIAAHVRKIRQALENMPRPFRILFSAHGLPEKIVQAGDPYQWQVEQSVAAILAELENENLDSGICYQSRVGPLKWIGPSTDDEIRRAGGEGKSLLVVPVAFVSEHSETLVELDIEYAGLAREAGVPHYRRVPALQADELFIESLAALAVKTVAREGVCSYQEKRICPAQFSQCPNRRHAV